MWGCDYNGNGVTGDDDEIRMSLRQSCAHTVS